MSAPRIGVTVLIVDDHPLVRRGLAAVLDLEPWVGRSVEASTSAEGERLAIAEQPGVAVIDLGLPDGSGLDLIHRLRRAVPSCAVLVLTMTRDDGLVRGCLAAGASGYVLKDSTPEVVLNALRTVADGGLVLGPRVGGPAALGPGRPAAMPPPLDRLQPRDLRLLSLVAEGRSNGQIARVMGISEKTVRNRLSGVLTTLGVADRVQAALLAREHGLPPPG
ncbi:DNA-binding response regulator [Actinoplanes sp. OR16]|uniref:response regulator n=1 Tax=Actinoplanes sp. OR16 TaxID=946334 RepID=UPI000F71F717|nr:response regulator transcription factor [Actinoplanes sp. OR16]BBH68630.1 DNA-binding response regulator [Actinoplanes sp. OR16]